MRGLEETCGFFLFSVQYNMARALRVLRRMKMAKGVIER